MATKSHGLGSITNLEQTWYISHLEGCPTDSPHHQEWINLAHKQWHSNTHWGWPMDWCGNLYQLPPTLIAFLNSKGIYPIAHIVDRLNSSIYQQAWKSANNIGIPDQWTQDWKNYTTTLFESHVRIKGWRWRSDLGPDSTWGIFTKRGIPHYPHYS